MHSCTHIHTRLQTVGGALSVIRIHDTDACTAYDGVDFDEVHVGRYA